MAKVTVTHKITFRPGQGGKSEPIILLPGTEKQALINNLPDEHLQDDYIQSLIKTGELSVLIDKPAEGQEEEATVPKAKKGKKPAEGQEEEKGKDGEGGEGQELPAKGNTEAE